MITRNDGGSFSVLARIGVAQAGRAPNLIGRTEVQILTAGRANKISDAGTVIASQLDGQKINRNTLGASHALPAKMR